MFMIVDYPEIAAAEMHRQELRRIAARTTRRRQPTLGAGGQPDAVPSLAERRRLLASLADAWADAPPKEIESADPLGVWSWGYPPRRSFTWPDRRVMFDWGPWLVLLIVAGYLAAVNS